MSLGFGRLNPQPKPSRFTGKTGMTLHHRSHRGDAVRVVRHDSHGFTESSSIERATHGPATRLPSVIVLGQERGPDMLHGECGEECERKRSLRRLPSICALIRPGLVLAPSSRLSGFRLEARGYPLTYFTHTGSTVYGCMSRPFPDVKTWVDFDFCSYSVLKHNMVRDMSLRI